MASPACDEARHQLTKREQEVFDLCMRGLTNKEIANDLGISVRTVEFHMYNIMNQLGVMSRFQLIAKGKAS